jgi:hypothetical protein
MTGIKMWKVKNRASVALSTGHHIIFRMISHYFPKQH